MNTLFILNAGMVRSVGGEVGLGCAMVRTLVEEHFRMRSWEMAERRRLHEQIISDSSHEAEQAARRAVRPGGIF